MVRFEFQMPPGATGKFLWSKIDELYHKQLFIKQLSKQNTDIHARRLEENSSSDDSDFHIWKIEADVQELRIPDRQLCLQHSATD